MSGFTPAPWSVPHFARPGVNCACEYVLHGGMFGAIASVHCSGEGGDWQQHGDNPNFDEAVANAFLIAAAPDLYNALFLARQFFATLDEIGPNREMLDLAWCAANDALTKAAVSASGMSASGQDAEERLEAKPASPTAESGDAHNG